MATSYNEYVNSVSSRLRFFWFMVTCSALLSACGQSAIDANNAAVQQNQAQIEQLQQEISALKAQQYSTAPASSGGCDADVMKDATRRGGEQIAAGALGKALNYYKDALIACPGNARAELNVGNTNEAMGDRAEAIEHYRKAAASTDPATADASQKARAALARLGAAN